MEKGKAKFGNKGLIILLSVLLVAIVGLGVGVAFVNLRGQDDAVQSDSESDEDLAKKLYEQEKVEAENQPSAEEYIEEIERQISEAGSAEEKSELYIERAETLYSRQNVGEGNFEKQIFNDLYKAEEIASSGKTAWVLYNYESLFGHDDIANRYYDLAIERGYAPKEDLYEE